MSLAKEAGTASFQSWGKGTGAVTCPWAHDTCHSELAMRWDMGMPGVPIPSIRLSVLSCSQARGGWKSFPTTSKHPTRLVKTWSGASQPPRVCISTRTVGVVCPMSLRHCVLKTCTQASFCSGVPGVKS